ncbi:MAG TPA: TolC family protein [Terriglobia bacterium]|jgi:outer membrane protein|nr:TolC family protein [Terriglobia bacterium]
MRLSSARALAKYVLFASLGLVLSVGPLAAQQNGAPTQAPAVSTQGSQASQPTGGLAPGATNHDYSQSHAFPNIFAPYLPEPVPEPSLNNSQLLHSLMVSGKLELSLDDAIALAIENNLTIAVQRFNVPFAQLDFLRAKAGGAPRGVAGAFLSNALFAGAVGAGLSSSSGGSSTSGGGALGGGGPINIGTISCCDPVAGFNYGWAYNVNPLNYQTVNLAPTVASHITSLSSFFGQGFLTGTSYAVGINGFRESSTSPAALFNPEVPTGAFFGIDQQLLNGFGYRANAKFIRIAQNDLKFADAAFRLQVSTTVAQVVNDYYTLLYDRQNVGVAEEAVNYSQHLLDDNKKQVQIGTLAPIEVVRAESELATDQQTLIVAQTTLKQQEQVLKTEISKQVTPDLADLEIDPTDKFPEAEAENVPPVDEALRVAYQNRQEITEADLNLANQDITLKAVRNALLPTLTAYASYTPSGLSGNQAVYGCPNTYTFNPLDNTCALGSAILPATITSTKPGGISQSFSGLFRSNYPYYSYGLSLSIPIRNRTEQADAARALFEQRQLQTQLQVQKNTIAQDVRNAEIAVTQAKAQINATIKAVDLARQTLDADQKKFQLGESTTFQLIQDQRDLTTAEGNQSKAFQTLATALTQFTQATGTTLDRYHVQLTDAKNGKVAHPPNIPGAPPVQGNVGLSQ